MVEAIAGVSATWSQRDEGLDVGDGLTVARALAFVQRPKMQQRLRTALFEAATADAATPQDIDDAALRITREWCHRWMAEVSHARWVARLRSGAPAKIMSLPTSESDFEREMMDTQTLRPSAFQRCVHGEYMREVYGNLV